MIVDVFFIVMCLILYFTESLILELATRVQKTLKEQEGLAGGFKFILFSILTGLIDFYSSLILYHNLRQKNYFGI